MSLSSKERTVLFETKLVSAQMRKYIETKQKVGYDEICAMFSDIPAGNVRSYLRRLIDHGYVSKVSGVYEATYKNDGKKAVGWKAESAWKAARLLRTFTVDDIARTSDIDADLSRWYCNQWKIQGATMVIGRNGRKPIYRIVDGKVLRPIGKEVANGK